MKPKLEFKREGNKLYSRVKEKDIRKNIGNCPFCGIPVYVSEGKLLTFRNGQPTHKYCRKEHDNR